MAAKSQFLSDEEKLNYFSSISKINLREYPHVFDMKVYEGLEILLFHYTDKYRDLQTPVIFDTVLTCTDISASDKGLRVSLFDRKAARLIKVGDVPNKMGDYDIITHIPYTCQVEKTMKRTYGDKIIQGLCASVCFRTRSTPLQRQPGEIQAMPYQRAQKLFTVNEYRAAIAVLEGRG